MCDVLTQTRSSAAQSERLLKAARLTFGRPKIVFEAGAAGAWDEFGVRDPALLVDTAGKLIREDGAWVMYYTGSCKDGRWQATGRAVSHDEGRTWVRAPGRPVLEPAPGQWDGSMASTPWVVLGDDGVYRLYYRGVGKPGRGEAIGLARSTNGVEFQRAEGGPILTCSDFADMPREGRRFMGVVNVVRMLDGRYLLTFEGSSLAHDRLAQIFAAVSTDGETFEPFNGGYPIFTARHVKTWSVTRVANPRITVLEHDNVYVLSFNGHYQSGLYGIGLAFTRDFKEWWEHPGNPVLAPSGSPTTDPFSGRIEGGVLLKEDLEDERRDVRMFVMGIPRKGPSHKNGVIGLSRARVDLASVGHMFRVVAADPKDAVVGPGSTAGSETLHLHQSDSDAFPARALVALRGEGVYGVRLDMRLEPSTEHGQALLVLGEDVDSILIGEGVQLAFRNGGLYLWRGLPGGSFGLHMHRQLRRRVDLSRWLGWKRVASYEHSEWHTIELGLLAGDCRVRVDGRDVGRVRTASVGIASVRDLAIQSDGQPLTVRNVQTLKRSTEVKKL